MHRRAAVHPSRAALVVSIGLLGLFAYSTGFAAQRLYVGNDNSPGGVLPFNLPISASSTANFTIPANNVVAVAVDSGGNMVIGDFSGNVSFFSAPLSAASVPAANFSNGIGANTGQVVFTPAGDFFVASAGQAVNKFTHPFSNASTPSQTITLPSGNSSIGTALDAAQNLYVSATSPGGSNLFVYAPPYSGAPITTPILSAPIYRKMAVSATQLIVASVAGATGQVDVYNLPITSASAPAFSITNGVNVPEAISLDAAGNLYVGNLVSSTITVYSPPFSAASAPITSLLHSAGPFSIFGTAIGGAPALVAAAPVPAPALDTRMLLLLAALLSASGAALRKATAAPQSERG